MEEIKTSFPNAQINIILDESGSIPSLLPFDTRYSFYDWKELELCRNIGAGQRSKLHAKILHFKTQQNIEFCLFGSANITPTGLGISNFANSEVSLFLKSNKENILNKIGLKIKGRNKKALANFTTNSNASIRENIIKNNSFSVKLLAAEINYNVLTIYSRSEIDALVSIAMFDNDNRLIQTQSIESLKSHHEINLHIDERKLKYIQILNTINNKIISNKIIVSNNSSIAKTHPNPKNAELEKLCGQLQNGELRNVLDLIHYAIIDESEKEVGTSDIKISSNKFQEEQKKETVQTQLYDLSRYKPIEQNSQLHENALLLSPSLRVLDALKLAYTQNSVLQTDIRTDEQIEDISNINGNDENEVKPEKNMSLKILEADKKKLKKFFKNLYGYFHDDILFKGTKIFDYKLTLTDLTKYLISLELIHEFGGKSEKVEDEQQQLFFTYLPMNGDYDNDNVKGCCLNIIGDFLRLARNRFKEYTFDYTKSKFSQLQHDALVSTIVCIINVGWKENEKLYLKTLLLNVLHYLGWSTTVELDKNIPSLISQVIIKANHLRHRSIHLNEQLSYFIDKVCKAIKSSATKRENKDFVHTATKGQIIYSSIAGVGYCYVVSVTQKNQYCLARPGFGWDENEGEFINHFGDTVYQLLPLPYLTIVDI